MRTSKSDKVAGLGLSVKRAAVDLGLARQMLHGILAETAAITLGMALRLERLTASRLQSG
jgi:plasmid maintenance system antidote protein VapI